MTPAPDRQKEAAKAGRKAAKAGEPVIYIHGRPYPDPAAENAREDQKAQT
jgi:basic membrane lipoprotein Med (substrate-binding protein (PBP1-ABC) superfamily)